MGKKRRAARIQIHFLTHCTHKHTQCSYTKLDPTLFFARHKNCTLTTYYSLGFVGNEQKKNFLYRSSFSFSSADFKKKEQK